MSLEGRLVMKKFNVKLTLLTDMLGTTPKKEDLYAGFISDKARAQLEKMEKQGIPHASGEAVSRNSIATALAEEQESIQDVEDRGWTGFFEDEKGPFVFDYFLKGFLCEAARTLKERGEGKTVVKQLHDKFKRYCFVFPRKVRLEPIAGCNERPIRAQTPQGPRVALIRSDFIKEGAVLEFQIRLLKGGQLTRDILEDVLSYGELMGLGQWRSGGWGRFTYEITELDA